MTIMTSVTTLVPTDFHTPIPSRRPRLRVGNEREENKKQLQAPRARLCAWHFLLGFPFNPDKDSNLSFTDSQSALRDGCLARVLPQDCKPGPLTSAPPSSSRDPFSLGLSGVGGQEAPINQGHSSHSPQHTVKGFIKGGPF